MLLELQRKGGSTKYFAGNAAGRLTIELSSAHIVEMAQGKKGDVKEELDGVFCLDWLLFAPLFLGRRLRGDLGQGKFSIKVRGLSKTRKVERTAKRKKRRPFRRLSWRKDLKARKLRWNSL